MRKNFEQQNTLDAIPIPEVKIDGKSRHQLPRLLADEPLGNISLRSGENEYEYGL